MTGKIAQISVYIHCNDLGGKVWNPAIRWTKKYAVFTVLTDDTGKAGLGECWCFDTAPDALVAYLRTEVAPHFIGIAAEDVPGVARALLQKATLTARHGILTSALSGIDIAAWDLCAQARNLPIWQCLAQDGPGHALLYASGGLYGEDKSLWDLCHEMAGFATRGFRLSKMKIGALSIEDDIARVKAVLKALPADVKLIVDGVYSYSADDALRVYEALPEGRIEAFQSPTVAANYAGMKRLSRAGVPVMATEAEYRPELHAKLVQDVGVAFLQTAPIASGGISAVMDMAAVVAGSPTRLSLEVSSTAVALIAAVQIAAAEPLVAHVEHHSVHTVFFDALRLRHGAEDHTKYAPPQTAGLGLELPSGQLSLAFEIGRDPFPKGGA